MYYIPPGITIKWWPAGHCPHMPTPGDTYFNTKYCYHLIYLKNGWEKLRWSIEKAQVVLPARIKKKVSDER